MPWLIKTFYWCKFFNFLPKIFTTVSVTTCYQVDWVVYYGWCLSDSLTWWGVWGSNFSLKGSIPLRFVDFLLVYWYSLLTPIRHARNKKRLPFASSSNPRERKSPIAFQQMAVSGKKTLSLRLQTNVHFNSPVKYGYIFQLFMW